MREMKRYFELFAHTKCLYHGLNRLSVKNRQFWFFARSEKIKFYFLQSTHNGEHIKNSKKNSENQIFDGAE